MIDLKEMSKKKKIEYIWDYYKVHIILTIVAIIIIVSSIHSQITKVHYEFNLVMVGNNYDRSKIQELTEKLTPIVIKNPTAKQSAKIEIMAVDSLVYGGTTTSAQYMQKFTVELSSSMMDLLILGKKDYFTFQNQGKLLKLDNLQGLDLSSIKAEKLEGTIETGEKGVYGISLKDNTLLKEIGINTEDNILCIPASTNQEDNSILAIKWILGNN